MEQKHASANLFLDRSRNLQGTKLHPVVIRVCYLRKQFPVGLKIYCTEKEFKAALSEKGNSSANVRLLREQLISKRTKAQQVLDSMKVVTKENFKKYFFSEIDLKKASQQVDIKSQFQLYIDECYADDRIRTAEWYQSALKSFTNFKGNVDMLTIDEDYLKKYRSHMLKRECSTSTIKMYFEALRCIFNRAIKAGIVHKKYYPFTDFQIGRSSKSKKCLYPQQVKRLYEHRPLTETQQQAVDLWFISYLAHGINTIDIFSLKWKQIEGDKITFIRSKTSKTVKELKEITVFIGDELRELIERNCNKDKRPNAYVFPLFVGLETEADRYAVLKEHKRLMNRCLNRLGKKLEFPGLLSLSMARHSFSTALKLKGENIAVISECLGHTSLSTTEHYLGTIPDEMMRNVGSKLLTFD